MWHTWTSGPGRWHRERTGFTPFSSSARSMAVRPPSRTPRTRTGMSQSRHIPKRGRGMPRTGFAEVGTPEYCTKRRKWDGHFTDNGSDICDNHLLFFLLQSYGGYLTVGVPFWVLVNSLNGKWCLHTSITTLLFYFILFYLLLLLLIYNFFNTFFYFILFY